MLRFDNKEVFEQLEGLLAEITAQFTTPNPLLKQEGSFDQIQLKYNSSNE